MYRSFLRESNAFKPDMREAIRQEVRSQFRHYEDAGGYLQYSAIENGYAMLKQLRILSHDLHSNSLGGNHWPW